MSWSETSRRDLLAAVLWSLCLAVGVLMHSTAVRGESSREEEGDSTGATTEASPTGTGGTTETSIGTTVGFVVVLLILVLAVLVTILLCVRQGLCACPFQKQPTPATPSARPPSRASRTSILSSSLRGNQRPMQSPNPMHSYHSNHHHHPHPHQHQHHHHHHQQYSPHSCDNGHTATPHNMHSLSGSRPLTMDLSYSQTTALAASLSHSHHGLSSSVESPPPHVSAYPGMPFPYQPCKSPPTPYCSNGGGFSIQSQVPRTPTSASITTLSSLSTMQNQRHGPSAPGGGGEGEGEKGVERGRGAEGRGRRGRRGGSEGEGESGREEAEKGRGGGREREEVQTQRQVESIHSESPPVPYTTQV